MTHASTLVSPNAPLARMSDQQRKWLIRGLWAVTWLGLLAGFADPAWWNATIAFSAAHAGLFTALTDLRPVAFPAQLRWVYVAFLMVAVWVPGLQWLMVVTTVGLLANLLFGYCPLARTLYLLPVNRDHALSPWQVLRVFVQPPAPGRFRVAD